MPLVFYPCVLLYVYPVYALVFNLFDSLLNKVSLLMEIVKVKSLPSQFLALQIFKVFGV